MNNRASFVVLLLLGLISSATGTFAGNWPQWRGPALNGAADTERNLPVEWSKTNQVRWVSPLPGQSGATPVIWGDSVFAMSPNEEKQVLLICLDRKNGAERWRKVIGPGNRDKGRNNMASPSPITDGKTVVAMMGTGKIAGFDFSGKELWSRDLGKEYGSFSYLWLYGASPLLHQGKLYVQVLHRSPEPSDYGLAAGESPERESYLLCLEPQTGANLWRHVRKTDAVDESMESYTTPMPLESAEGTQIVVVGGDYVTAHHADTGAEVWRCGGLNPRKDGWWRIVPSAVIAGDIVIACAPKRDPVFGIRAGGKGLVTETNIAWSFKEYPSDCVTPLLYQGKLFVLDGDRQMMTCLDPRTGEKKWQGNLGLREVFRASPTGADGKIFCVNESGTVVVLSAGDEFKVLSTIPMGESPVRSSVAISDGQLFIRTGKNLYCIGK